MPAPKKHPPKRAAAPPPAPPKNTLVAVAEAAQREALLGALTANAWNLTAAASALGLHGPSAVIRYIHSLGLDDQYAAARESGAVKQGRPKE